MSGATCIATSMSTQSWNDAASTDLVLERLPRPAHRLRRGLRLELSRHPGELGQVGYGRDVWEVVDSSSVERDASAS